jgi:hypothetical protein
MKTIISVEDCNKVLGNYAGASTQIWSFHITHKRLILRLWWWSEDEHKIKDEIFLAALSCEHIVGSFYLEKSSLSIAKEIDLVSNEPVYRILDKYSEFELIATGGVGLLDTLELDSDEADGNTSK